MILTADQLEEITGKRRSRSQVDVLAALGIPYKVRPDGKVIVLRAAFEVALGYASTPKRSTPPQVRLPAQR